MISFREWAKFTLVLLLLALTAGCADQSPAIGQGLYTQHNLWYQYPSRMFSINYKIGTLIPAGTKITKIRVGRRTIKFKAGGISFRMRFNPRYHPGENSMAYTKKMFGSKTREQLTAGMTQVELKAIRTGQPAWGMSKKAVLVMYGYPPSHRTFSLEADRWQFWLTRWRTQALCFNEQGKVANCGDLFSPPWHPPWPAPWHTRTPEGEHSRFLSSEIPINISRT